MPLNSLKIIREAAGFKRAKDLASHAEISPSHLSTLEGGNGKFTNEVLEKLCKALNVSRDQILKQPPQLLPNGSPQNTVRTDLTAEQIRLTHLEKMLIDLASHLPGTQGEARTAYILSLWGTLKELSAGKEPK
jgi:transcriptional regulator with XRE-family HTH domain